MDKDLAHVKQNTFRYWFQDGLSDIVVGSFFVIIGVINLIQGFLKPGSVFSGLSGFAVLIIVVVGIPISRRIVRAVKEKITYPRTGYVAYQKPSSTQRLLSVILGLSMAVIIAVLVLISERVSILWIPFLLSFALAGFLVVIGRRIALIRYQFMALLLIIVGLVLSLSGFSVPVSTGIVYASTGLMLFLSGVVVFIRYIRNTMPDHEDQNGS